MKTTILILAISALLPAQQTRREVTNPSNPPSDDARPNSNTVPDVVAMKSTFERVVILRFKYDTELLGGLEKMIQQEKIRNAVILSAIGSVRGYQVHQVSNRTLPSKNTFVKDPTMPADLLTMTGYVMNGRLHAHVTLATPNGAFGGHLEPDTRVFTFVAVTLGILGDGVDITRLDDKTYR